MKKAKSSIYKAVRKLPLHDLYNSAPDAIILADTATGQIVNVNKAARLMLGRTLKDLIGRNITELHPEEVRKEVGKIFQSLNTQGGRKAIRQPLETFILKSDGSKVPVEITAQLIKMNDIVIAQGIFRDISRRKMIENALRESEEKYRNLVERATDGIVIIVDGNIEYCNSSLCRMTGYRQVELMGKPFHDFLQKEEKSQLVERYQKRIRGFPVERIYETIIRKKNGEVLFTEINSDLISFEGKAGVLSIIRDVTVRKKTDQAKNELNDQLHTLINAIPDLVYFKDKDGHNLLFNKAFESFVGKNARYIRGKKDRELLPSELVKLCESSDSEVFKNKKIQRFEENHNWMEDKSHRFFETIKSPIFDEQGNLIGLVGISRDITDRKKAEKELHFRLESQNIISSISAKFTRIKWPDIGKEVEFALYKVCDFLKVEFGSVFLFSDGSSTVRKKYEWIDPKIPRKGSGNNVWDTKQFREVMRKINHYETFFFTSVDIH
jgi:PAS domain S-box-containing protein